MAAEFIRLVQSLHHHHPFPDRNVCVHGWLCSDDHREIKYKSVISGSTTHAKEDDDIERSMDSHMNMRSAAK